MSGDQNAGAGDRLDAPGREEAIRQIAHGIVVAHIDWNASSDDVVVLDIAQRISALSPSSAHPAQGLVKALERAGDWIANGDGNNASEADSVLAQINAALSAQGKDDGWFRIDDPENPAPKDGTLVIIGFYRSNVFETADGKPQAWATLGKYVENDPPPMTPSAWQTSYGQGFSWPPTHWRPLPAPPSTPSREG